MRNEIAIASDESTQPMEGVADGGTMLSKRLTLLAPLLVACSPRALPPPTLPPTATLAEPTQPPAPGHGRVIVAVVGESAKVERVQSRSNLEVYGLGMPTSENDLQAQPLCTTPCVLDLPYGSHELRFGVKRPRRTDTDFVVAGPKTTRFLYAPGESRPRKAAQILGGAAALTGGFFTFLGGVAIAGQKDDATHDQRRNAVTLTAVSAGVMVLGIATLLLLPPEHRPAASQQWEVSQ